MINSKNIPKKKSTTESTEYAEVKQVYSLCALCSLWLKLPGIFLMTCHTRPPRAENKGHRKIKMDREALECKDLFRFVLEVYKDTKSERGLLHKAIRRSSTMMLFLCVFAPLRLNFFVKRRGAKTQRDIDLCLKDQY